MTGLAMGSFEKAINYCVNDRKQFGKFIGEFQGMQFQFAQEAMEIEAARLLVYNAARLKEAGLPFVKEAAFAKLFGILNMLEIRLTTGSKPSRAAREWIERRADGRSWIHEGAGGRKVLAV